MDAVQEKKISMRILHQFFRKLPNMEARLSFILYIFSFIGLTFAAVTAVYARDIMDYKSSREQIARAVIEIICYCIIILTLTEGTCMFCRKELEVVKNPMNWLTIISSVLLLSVLPLRFIDSETHWHVFAFGYLLWVLRIFAFASIFPDSGTYIQVLWAVFTRDMWQFMMVFAIILVAFSGTFLLSLRGDNTLNAFQETSGYWRILFVGVRTIVEASSTINYTSGGYTPVNIFLLIFFMFVCITLLLNLLIAQLNNTYQEVRDKANRMYELKRAFIARGWERAQYGRKARVIHYIDYEDVNIFDKLGRKVDVNTSENAQFLNQVREAQRRHDADLLNIKKCLTDILKVIQEIKNLQEKPEIDPGEIKM